MDGLREGQNWLIRRGRLRLRPGLATFTNAPGGFEEGEFEPDDFEMEGADFLLRPMGIYQYDHQDGSTRTVAGTRAYWYQLNSSSLVWEDITGAGTLSGSNTSHVRFRGFPKHGETWLLGVNGSNTPKVWDGQAPTYRDMGGGAPVAEAIAVSANRVLLGNLITGPTVSHAGVDVSAFNDFDSGWGAQQTTILAETPGRIVAMEELSALSVAIYKTDAIYVCSAVGAIDPFRFELRRAGVSGPASAAAVCKISDGSHVYRAYDGSLFRFDGMNLAQMSESSRFLFSVMAQEAYKNRAWTMFDPRYNEVWTFFVDKTTGDGDPNVAIVDTLTPDSMGVQATWLMRWDKHRFSAGQVMNVETGISIGEFVGTIGDQTIALGEYSTRVERMGLCSVTGFIFEDTGKDDAGQPISHHFESGLVDLEYPGWKEVVETDHYFERVAHETEVAVRIGVSDDGAERELSEASAFDVSVPGPYAVGHRVSGRLVSFRVEGQSHEQLVWRGGFVSMVPRGLR